MNEKEVELLEKYSLTATHMKRARGGFVCNTVRGPVLFKEYRGSEKHLLIENAILEKIRNSGIIKSDYIVKNDSGELITSCDDKNYILKVWYHSRECNIRDKGDVLRACKMIAEVHNVLRGDMGDTKFDLYPCNLVNEYKRHTSEMKRARNYIRNKNNKTDFELKILKCFDRFYLKAVEAEKCLEECEYEKHREYAYLNQTVCHGAFNYHNILMTEKNAILVNYERAVIDIQLTDFYDFIRKVMEKYNWEKELGRNMFREYMNVKYISEQEKRLLKVMLMYPEKFWKIVNQYYNGNKTLISEKNIDKLNVICSQEEQKQTFIDTFDFIG